MTDSAFRFDALACRKSWRGGSRHCRWHVSLPGEGRNAPAEYLAGHIPGAVFFDIDKIADHSTDLPHMLPSPAVFAKPPPVARAQRDDPNRRV